MGNVKKQITKYLEDMSQTVVNRKFIKYRKNPSYINEIKMVDGISEKYLHGYVPKGMLNRTSSIPSKLGEAIIQIFEY